MVRGISFTAKHPTGDTLYDILTEIGADAYCWRIIKSQTEAMDSTFEEKIFQKEYYKGRELMNCKFHNSLIIFLKLEAYVGKCDSEDIITYADFRTSCCQMLLLVNDSENVEIYLKSDNILHRIEMYLRRCRCYDYSLITDENDARTRLEVL